MIAIDKDPQSMYFLTQRKPILLRGILMTLIGLFLCMMVLTHVQVQIMSIPNAGW